MVGFDANARLALLSRTSLARSVWSDSPSLWTAGVRQELRDWILLGQALEFLPTDGPVDILCDRIGLSIEAPDSHLAELEEWSTAEKQRVYPQIQAALSLADRLHADAGASRLLSALTFDGDDEWNAALEPQIQLVNAVQSVGAEAFDRITLIASGATWMFDGTARLLGHLQAFHAWMEANKGPAALQVARAVARLQRWRLNVAEKGTLERLNRVVQATHDAVEWLNDLEERAGKENARVHAERAKPPKLPAELFGEGIPELEDDSAS
jgi:hypothetical protein